ncbi:hypothetical protein [Microlunatus capsulatus]|uniref:hypothetical protein n=1 Tax=Microlunatus capsulatus TaxID=99117 RepID=UPI0031D50131
MTDWNKIKKVKSAVSQKLDETDLAKTAADAVLGASDLINGAEAVAERSGLTKRDGSLSKIKIARAATRPKDTARKLLDATAEEIRARRDRPRVDE